MKKDYLKRDDVKKTEQTWCKISNGELEFLDWSFVEQHAQQFDDVGDAGVRDKVMTMCKLLVLVRDQTIDRTITMMARFKETNNDAAAVIIFDPLAKPVVPSPFVFFHVGDDSVLAEKLVDSIRKTNPESRIIMCTDTLTPIVDGVERREFSVDRERLMYERWRTYAELGLRETAVYLDTDMIVRGAIDATAILGDKKFVFCSRSFNKNSGFNGYQRGIDFSEHDGKPIGTVYPVLGCFVITRSSEEWKELFARYEKLGDKWKRWYGDQEVLRDFKGDVKYVEEANYACLPEHVGKTAPFIVHYKGNRKNAIA